MTTLAHPPVRTRACPACGVGFSCGLDAATRRCWCDGLPAILPPDPALSCLCPECLKTKLRGAIDGFIRALPPHARRQSLAMKYARPDAPLVEDFDFYWENGYRVFTAWHHLKRGECCGNGCRHCPYPA